MENLMLIETSTELCSTAMASDGKIVSYRESDTPRSHASMTAVFADEMLKETGLNVRDCSAVCVSMGPGSYTGLRVGVWQAIGTVLPEGCRYIVPMIDARRMEVYTAIFSPDGKQLTGTEARIIDADSFGQQLAEGPVLFIGDAAEKCRTAITHPNAHFIQCCPKASSMLIPAMMEYKEKRFKDVAYFEPFYLKNFVATVSRKKLF